MNSKCGDHRAMMESEQDNIALLSVLEGTCGRTLRLGTVSVRRVDSMRSFIALISHPRHFKHILVVLTESLVNFVLHEPCLHTILQRLNIL